METIFDSGIPIIQFLQSLGPGLIAMMKAFTFLGNEQFYLLIFPALYWCIDNTLGLRAGIILMLSGIFNSYFKWVLHLPRPYWYSTEVSAFSSETSFGAPSGHSQNAVAVWGIIAANLRKSWAWIVAVLLMFLIGLSRLALGVHFHLDVLLGWLIGGLLLWGFLRWEAPVAAWMKKKSLNNQIASLFLISLGLIALGSLILAVVGSWPLPPEWVQNAANATPEAGPIDPFSLSGVVSNAAVLFGLAGGAILFEARGGFDVGGHLWKRVARYVIGLIGVLLIWAGLDQIFPEGNTLIPYIFRYLRYGLAGAWISLGAPWAFIRLKLAEPLRKQR